MAAPQHRLEMSVSLVTDDNGINHVVADALVLTSEPKQDSGFEWINVVKLVRYSSDFPYTQDVDDIGLRRLSTELFLSIGKNISTLPDPFALRGLSNAAADKITKYDSDVMRIADPRGSLLEIVGVYGQILTLRESDR